MNIAELKSKAKLQIQGKIGVLFAITLIMSLISAAVSSLLSMLIPGAGILVAAVVSAAFALSVARVYLMLIRGIDPEAKDAFCGFDDFWSAFKVSFFVGLYTYLWSLLLIVPGIIKSISYSMSMYILAENKGKSAHECIKESKAMTEGHKMELFMLGLSFIGWVLLGFVTLGISYIWVVPYIRATFANAYVSLKPVVEEPYEDVTFDGYEAQAEYAPATEDHEVSAHEMQMPVASGPLTTEDSSENI